MKDRLSIQLLHLFCSSFYLPSFLAYNTSNNITLISSSFRPSPGQAVVWGVYRARVAVRERCCGRRSSLATLPHPATMDVILGRDASMESVYARTQDPVTTQTVSLSTTAPHTIYQPNATRAPVTQPV